MKFSEYKWGKPETDAHQYIFPVIFSLIEGYKVPKNALILDAGCGGGNLLSVLYGYGFENIYGFDISKSGIETALKCFPFLKGKVFVHDGYDKDLPLDIPQQFDVVISLEVIEHLFSPDTYLRNVNKWLKEEGFLIISTPYHGFLKNVVIALLGKFDTHFNPLFEGGHIKFFSMATLAKLLSKNGFDILKFKGAGRVPYLWKSMVIVAQKTRCL